MKRFNSPEDEALFQAWKDELEESWVDTDILEIRIRIAKHLLLERTNLGLSTRELAKLSGVTDRQILRIEHMDPDHPKFDPSYTDMPSLTTIVKLANALRCSVLRIIWCSRFSQDQEDF